MGRGWRRSKAATASVLYPTSVFQMYQEPVTASKDVQGRYYDSMVSHTTIVFTRYIVLAWQHRCTSDDRTLGGLFYELCDEIHELDWAVALQQLIELLMDVMNKTSKKITNLIKSQLQQWIDGLPTQVKPTKGYPIRLPYNGMLWFVAFNIAI